MEDYVWVHKWGKLIFDVLKSSIFSLIQVKIQQRSNVSYLKVIVETIFFSYWKNWWKVELSQLQRIGNKVIDKKKKDSLQFFTVEPFLKAKTFFLGINLNVCGIFFEINQNFNSYSKNMPKLLLYSTFNFLGIFYRWKLYFTATQLY